MDIVTGLIEQGEAEVKSEFIQATSEAKTKVENQMSNLLGEVTKTFQQIMDETETNIRVELKHFATLTRDE